MVAEEFKLRREQLLKSIGHNSVAIIFAAKEFVDGGGMNLPYRQNSDFYYLTGFSEPEALAVLLPGRNEGEFVLFNRKRDPQQEQWSGACAGQEGVCEIFGADQAFAISAVDEILPKLLVGRETIYFSIGHDKDCDQNIIFWINACRRQAFSKEDDGTKLPLTFPYKQVNLNKVLHPMRLKKIKPELDQMRKAAAITVQGHLRAMQRCCPGMHEFELKAELLYEFTRQGGREAFASIIASGKNACTLHYSDNDKKILSGDMVLVDAGAEYKHYCADVSRTFPVNGKFTREQSIIYEIVLAAQTEAIKEIRPGASWHHLRSVVRRVIADGLLKLNLIREEEENLNANLGVQSFFPHDIGHWLGLNVHDVGDYYVDREWRTFESGMVLTIEPGIYIARKLLGANIDNKWCDIGVRIEDDILVTDDGCEVLTRELPKDIATIEDVMKK